MSNSITYKIWAEKLAKSPIATNLIKLIFFGLLGGMFGSIEFPISNSEGLVSNFGEIPLIISTLFFSNPVYLLLTTTVAFLVSSVDPASYLWGILTHFLALLPIWYFYHFIIKKKRGQSNFLQAVNVGFGVLAYYFLLLLPLITLKSTIENVDVSIINEYLSLINYLSIEIFTTLICVILIYMYYMNYLKLKRRAVELQIRNEKLEGYAFINSHVLRAPLSRILGLSMIFQKEDPVNSAEVVAMLQDSCEELDEIVKLINKYVSESESDKNQDTKVMLKRISDDYYKIVNRQQRSGQPGMAKTESEELID